MDDLSTKSNITAQSASEQSTGALHERIYQQEHADLFVAKPPFPRNIMIETCNGCNHRCRFCYNREMERQVGLIDPELMYRILREGYEFGAREVGFSTTGEALLNPKLFEYVAYAKQLGYEYTYFSTNGARFNDKKIAALFESGLDSIKFSVNAGKKDTYETIHGRNDFEHVVSVIQTIDQIRKDRKTPLKLFVTSIVTPESEGEQEALRTAIGQYVDDLAFIQETGAVGPTNSTNTPLPCPMLFNRMHITWEGFVTCCCVDYENQLIITDLHEFNLLDAWHHSVFQSFRERHIRQDVGGTLCKVCVTRVMEPYEPLTFVSKRNRKTEAVEFLASKPS